MFNRFRVGSAGAYGLAVLAVAVSALARSAVDPIAHNKGPFLFFAFGVVVAALHGGFRAGVTATALSVIAGDFLFVEPRYTLFTKDAFGDSTMIILFAALGVALSVLIERLRRADEGVRQSRETLADANSLLQERQRELEIVNDRFRMAMDTSEEAIWEMNLEARTASWSDLYAKRFGRRPADSSLEWWFEHIHPDDRESVRTSFWSALTGSAAGWAHEYRMQRADGAWANVYDRASIARKPDGTPLRAVGAILDVSEIRRAQDELERRTGELARSNEDLQRFAFAVSHDLQAPLRMIADYGQQLAKANLNQEPDRLVRLIVESAARLRKIVHDLLEFARVSSQPAPPELCTHSDVILDLALQHLQFAIQESGAQITAERLPIVMVNETRLLQVFQNLIGNALKYRQGAPRIHVSARREDDMVTFLIKDNGIGVAPEYHERIFGMFERLQGRDQHSGTGLGLAITKRIVEAQGGRIWLESKLGEGSTFYFNLRAGDDAAHAHRA